MVRWASSAAVVAVLAGCSHAPPAMPPPPASAPAPTAAAPAPDLLDKLVGRWVLSGVIAHQTTVHDVEAAWVLHHTYVRITEVSRETGDDGAPRYEAVIYVGWLKDHYVCIWLDNTEVASGDIACTAPTAPDAIPFQFRDRRGDLGIRTTFSYHRADDSWGWRISNVEGNNEDVFADVTLRRR